MLPFSTDWKQGFVVQQKTKSIITFSMLQFKWSEGNQTPLHPLVCFQASENLIH